MSTDVTAKAANATAEATDGKKKRVVHRTRSKRVAYVVPDGGLKSYEVDGFDPRGHIALDESSFGGNKLLLLKHQRWLHEQAIENLDSKIENVEELDPIVQESMCKVMDDISSATRNLKLAKVKAAAELSPEDQAKQNEVMARQLQELAKQLLSGKK